MSTRQAVMGVGAVAFDDDGDRVLLIQRGKEPGEGLWTVPGGRVEFGESLADAVIRELYEETGLHATCGPMVEIVERTGGQGDSAYHFVIHDYLVFISHGNAAPRAGSDARAVAWVSREELRTLPTTDGLQAVLDHGLAIWHQLR